MTSMFWGLRLDPGKRYSTTVDKSFHVSMAALDCGSVKSDLEVLSVMLEEGESNVSFILCNLQKKKALQCSLDLNFLSGDRITFFCKGTGVVHLSGYIVPEDDFNPLEDEEGEEEEDEEEDEDEEDGVDDSLASLKGIKKQMNGTAGKRKLDQVGGLAKKKKNEDDSEDSEDDDDDDDEDEDGDSKLLSSLDLMGSDDSDEESDEEESDSEKNETPQVISPQKKEKNKKNQNAQNIAKQQQQQKKQKTPNKGATPQGKKGAKTETTPNSGQKLNKSNSDDSSPQKKEGGVHVKDIKVGNGPVCTKGKQATVYYTGRFKSNNKVFDSSTQGPGFKFKVGKGEVIKGWDVGVVGMKVGGKRLITCPPHMAYGPKGSPPTIPGNSTLMFEVELKSVNN